jgi:hypothetical protein
VTHGRELLSGFAPGRNASAVTATTLPALICTPL